MPGPPGRGQHSEALRWPANPANETATASFLSGASQQSQLRPLPIASGNDVVGAATMAPDGAKLSSWRAVTTAALWPDRSRMTPQRRFGVAIFRGAKGFLDHFVG
jgi:hypothetical protein